MDYGPIRSPGETGIAMGSLHSVAAGSAFPILVLAAAAAWAPPAAAHCPDTLMTHTLDTLREGVTVQRSCYPVTPPVCIADTFYQEAFEARLVREFHDRRYAVFGYVEGVEQYRTLDSIYYRGQLYYVDTVAAERVHIRIHAFLKDSLPVRRLTFEERIPGLAATTYAPLRDTPFVAFFDAYDSLHRMGLGPMDGCFYEPTGWFLQGGRVHRKGLPGDRMAGLSVSEEGFFSLLGLDPVPFPPTGIRRDPGRPAGRPSAPGARRYDLNGRRLRAEGGRGRTHPAISLPDTRTLPGAREDM